MKQSFTAALLQLFNLFLGIAILFFFSSRLPNRLFSLIAIYDIITSLMTVFSYLGLEQVFCRNALYWEKSDQSAVRAKAKLFFMGAIISRFALSMLLLVFVGLYARYLSIEKFHGQFFFLLLAMGGSGILCALNTCLLLMAAGMNRFVANAIGSVLQQTLTKLLVIIVFLKLGFWVAICFLIISPVLLTVYLLFFFKRYFDFSVIRKISWKMYFSSSSLTFTFSGWIRYGYMYLGQLLVSFLFPISILSTFYIAMRLENAGKQLVEYFFSPMLQHLVGIKDKRVEVSRVIIFVKKIKFFLFVFGVILLPLVYKLVDGLIIWEAGFQKYPYILDYIVSAYLASLFYLLSFDNMYLVSVLGKVKSYLWQELWLFMWGLALILVFGYCAPENYFYSYRVVLMLVMLFISYYMRTKMPYEVKLKSFIPGAKAMRI